MLCAAAFGTEFENRTQIFVRHHNRRLDHRLLNRRHLRQIRHIGRIVQRYRFAVGHVDFISHRGCRRNQVKIKLAPQPLLNNFHMQQPEKTAAEPQPQSGRIFVLIIDARIVELQLGQSVFQTLVLTAVNRKNRTEHDRHRRLKPVQRRGAGIFVVGNRIADPAVADALDARGQKTDLPRIQRLNVLHFRRKNTDFFHLISRVAAHHPYLHFLFQHAVLNPHQNYHAQIRIIPAVNQQRLQRRFGTALRRREPMNNRLKQILHAQTGLAGSFYRVGRIQPDDVFNLLLDPHRIRGRQINLV